KTTFNAGIGPIEAIDAQCFLAGRQAKRHRDKKATFECADFDKRTANAERRLPSNKVPANSGGEAGGHAPHPLVALREIKINAGMAAGDVKHQMTPLLSRTCILQWQPHRSSG